MNCMHMLVGRPLSRCLKGRRKLVMFMLPLVSIGYKVEQSRYKSKEKVCCVCLKLNSYIQSMEEF